jgi:hypothetical protein
MTDTVTIPKEIFRRIHKMHVEIEREMEKLNLPIPVRDGLWDNYESRHGELLEVLRRPLVEAWKEAAKA